MILNIPEMHKFNFVFLHPESANCSIKLLLKVSESLLIKKIPKFSCIVRMFSGDCHSSQYSFSFSLMMRSEAQKLTDLTRGGQTLSILISARLVSYGKLAA